MGVIAYLSAQGLCAMAGLTGGYGTTLLAYLLGFSQGGPIPGTLAAGAAHFYGAPFAAQSYLAACEAAALTSPTI